MSNLIKKILLFTFAVFLISSVSYSQDDVKASSDAASSDEPSGIKMSDGILYGKDYDPNKQVVEFSEFISNAKDNDGKEVLIKGNISEVCQEMGCWMVISDGTNNVRILTNHNFFVPKDIAGRSAVVVGTFKVTELSEEEANHYNKESGDPSMKTQDVKGPQKEYEIDAFGIKVLNTEGNSESD
jgi:Domain of unknown function (DUF4920)